MFNFCKAAVRQGAEQHQAQQDTDQASLAELAVMDKNMRLKDLVGTA